MQDLDAERAAEQAEAQQQAEAAQAKKRKGYSDTAPPSTKKLKMVSVQQLHTTSPDNSLAQAAQQSRSASQSRSAASGKRPIANSTSIEAGPHVIREGPDGINPDEASSPRAKPGSIHPGGPGAQQAGRLETRLHTNAEAASDKSKLAPNATAPESQAAEQLESKAEGMLTNVKEYFVKWKGKSFLHCSWVRHDDVVKVARLSAGLNMRLKNYQRSVYGVPQVGLCPRIYLCSIPHGPMCLW